MQGSGEPADQIATTNTKGCVRFELNFWGRIMIVRCLMVLVRTGFGIVSRATGCPRRSVVREAVFCYELGRLEVRLIVES